VNLLAKYEWLLFDADNTLFDFDNASINAFHQTLLDYDIELGENSYLVYKEINLKVWEELEMGLIDQVELRRKRFSLFLDHFNLDKDPVKMNKDYLHNLVLKSELIHDSIRTLNYLKPLFKLGIITNGLKEVQRPRIKKVEIEEYFEVIIVSDEIGHAKPRKEFFDHTFMEIGHPSKEKVMVIGDSLKSDIKGGLDYGLDTCWYNPNLKKNNHSWQPTFTIRKLSSLIGS
jgi:putative hydrolase of the HAD superfamily